MAERVTAFPIRIGEAFVQRLKDHLAANREQWYRVPARIEFGLTSKWEDGPYPMIGVTAASLEDQSASGPFDNQMVRSEIRLTVVVWIRENGNPERALHELVSDIRRAFSDTTDGRQLGDALTSGVLFFDGWEAHPDDSGLSVALIGFRGLFDWTEAAA